jgi:hypothetical protein
MMELSRASGRKAVLFLLRSRAQYGANAAISELWNQPPQRTAKRLCAWACALALGAFAGIGAHAQQQAPTAPVGDIYESGTPQPVEQAFQKLYEIAAEITADPSSLYVQGQVDKSQWPAVDQAQAQWDTAMGQAGTALTQDQRNNIVPCAAHLNAAIADMERGYPIHITQESNAPAQATATALYGEGKDEFAKCPATGVATDAGETPGTTSGSTPETPPLGSPGTPHSGTLPSSTGSKPILKGRITNGPDEPSNGGPNQPTGNEPSPSSNPVSNGVQYLQGMAAGVGNCIQGVGSKIAGLGYFAQGDFVDAAKAWGVTPGDSVTLKAIAAELTTLVVGSNVTAYDQGVAAGRRICTYVLIPGATKAAGAALKGRAPPPVSASAKTPIQGSALQEAINDAPQKIANQPVQLQKGVAQLGDYVDKGSFASVYKYGKASVIKLSRTDADAAGYGPASIEGQRNGFNHLKAADIDTPKLSDFQAGNSNSPASIVAEDGTKKYPNSFQLSRDSYNKMPPAQQGKIVSAMQDLNNQLTKNGLGSIDSNPGNLTMQPVGDGFKAILHDSDMIYDMGELQELVKGTLPDGMIPKGVLDFSLDAGGAKDLLSGPWTLESLMETVQNARMQRLLPLPLPEGKILSTPPQINAPSGTVPVAPR